MRRGVLVIGLIVSACAPKLVQNSPAGGMISMAGVTGEKAKAAQIAEAECAKHGRQGRITRFDILSDTVSYECVTQ